MPSYKVNVKWGKEKFQDVECNTDESPMLFKAQLYALSGVQPDRQKILMKGSVLKDDDWGPVKLKDGMSLLMMGSAEALPEAPKEKTVFMEDMSAAQLATALEVPPGLNNLGNTCYMNATVQCLKSVPELREALKKYTGALTLVGGMSMPADSITAALRDLYNSMDRSGTSLPPSIFLHVLHMAFPRFAEKGENGAFQQQDANECWTEVVLCLQQKLPGLPGDKQEAAGAVRGFMDQFMAGETETVLKCTEAPDEEKIVKVEKFYQLSCYIEKEIKYMHTGLRAGLEGSLTRFSETLQRDAVYSKTMRIKRLPAYLSIQMVRFFFKGREAINAKILKDVKFTLNLDVFDMCTEELQKKLTPMREKFKEIEDKKTEEAQKGKPQEKGEEAVKKKMKALPYSFDDDIGSNNSGYYELQAVLTHKGRSSSSGHYVAWVRRKDDEWLMFDDDRVSPVTAEDILKLSGGGDWHSAYVLLYGPRVLEVEDEEAEEGEGAQQAAPTPMEQS